VILDLDAQPHDPALYLIDFDAFFAPAAGANCAVTVAEGGTSARQVTARQTS
jgi:hypothetical protein